MQQLLRILFYSGPGSDHPDFHRLDGEQSKRWAKSPAKLNY